MTYRIVIGPQVWKDYTDLSKARAYAIKRLQKRNNEYGPEIVFYSTSNNIVGKVFPPMFNGNTGFEWYECRAPHVGETSRLNMDGTLAVMKDYVVAIVTVDGGDRVSDSKEVKAKGIDDLRAKLRKQYGDALLRNPNMAVSVTDASHIPSKRWEAGRISAVTTHDGKEVLAWSVYSKKHRLLSRDLLLRNGRLGGH